MKYFQKYVSIVIMASLFAFILCGAASATTTPITTHTVQNQTTTQSDTIQAKSSTLSTAKSVTVSSKATTTSTKFSISDIKVGAIKVKKFMDTNNRLPNYVTINGTQIKMAPFLHLLTQATILINSKSTKTLSLTSDTLPSASVDIMKSGTVNRTSYIDFAKRINIYMNNNHQAPPYGLISLGKVSYKSQIYFYSTILNYYNINKKLPNYVKMSPFGSTPTNINGWVTVKNLIYYQQPNDYSCGPSSLKMVLSNYGLNLDERWLETAAGTVSSNGTSHSGLIRAVNTVNSVYGTHFTAWNDNLANLTWSGVNSQFISKNHPIILHVKSWLSSGGHYVVLAGLNLSGKLAKLADPSYGGYRYVSFSELEYRMSWITSTGRSNNPIIAISN